MFAPAFQEPSSFEMLAWERRGLRIYRTAAMRAGESAGARRERRGRRFECADSGREGGNTARGVAEVGWPKWAQRSVEAATAEGAMVPRERRGALRELGLVATISAGGWTIG